MLQSLTASTAANVADELTGLSLGDAFIRYVLQDTAVVEISQKLLATKPSYASIFNDGVVPGPTTDFHWHLKYPAEIMATDFGRPIMFMLGDPMHRPSDLESAVSVAIVAAMARFQGLLASGVLFAVGTFVGTGAEVAVGIGQWRRKDLAIDVENSAICDEKCEPIWTGVWLQTGKQRVETAQSTLDASGDRFEKTRKQVSTKEKSRKECLAFILSLISDPDADPLSKDELWGRVQKKWPGKIGVRQFDECRRDALKQVNEEQRILWTRPGPRGTRS